MFILNNENAFGFTAFDTNTGFHYVFNVNKSLLGGGSQDVWYACRLMVFCGEFSQEAGDEPRVAVTDNAAQSFVMQLVPLMQHEISPTLKEPVYKVIAPVLSNATLAIAEFEKIKEENSDG